MRSIADQLRAEEREALLALSPSARVALALMLGDRDLESYRLAQRPALARGDAVRRLDAPPADARRLWTRILAT